MPMRSRIMHEELHFLHLLWTFLCLADDENRLPTLTVLPKNWPANIGLPYVLHTVAGLLLKMKKHAIRVTLILAKMSS